MTDFQCPITHVLMENPVVAPDGWSYERAAIENWVRQHGVSPMTRQPITMNQLVPNISMRKAIEQYRLEHPDFVFPVIPAVEAPAAAAAPVAPADPSLNIRKFEHQNDTYLHVSMELPTRSPANRKNVFVVAVVDISGSMGASANPHNAEESMFTRLDLVKHTLRTFVTSLGPQDVFSVIAYDNTASVEVTPTLMTDANKHTAMQVIDRLAPRGGTNIWGALERTIQLINTSNTDMEQYNVGCFLLTDGEANVNPPRGIIASLKDKLDASPIPYAINTFGYGYTIDSPLLSEIANMTDGTYGFIPDASMVGTVFVNALANLMATGASKTELKVDDIGCEVLGPQRLTNGSLVFGGNRSYLLKMHPDADAADWDGMPLKITAKFGQTEVVREFTLEDCELLSADIFHGELARVKMMDVVQTAFDLAKRSDIAGAARVLREFQELLQNSDGKDVERVQAIIRDLDSPLDSEGQLMKALGHPEWYKRWGRHYVPHFLSAHGLQHCLNFKDQSIQQFGGDLFQSMQKTLESAFIDIPAPTPSRAVRAGVTVPTRMTSYYNVSGGCFLGNGKVQTQNGKDVLVQDVRRGDRVLTSTANNTYGTVRCVVRMEVEEPMKFVNINGLTITDWHPVRQNGQWVFPADLPEKDFERVTLVPYDKFVYDFVMEHEHAVVINGTEAITLGHGIEQDPVASHAYLGTQAIINDLKKLSGWQEGLITLKSSQYIRDSQNKICGIVGLA